ncbi:MAG: sigma-70 family RNA polymerase sigma factor [bacterium]|nr:sigma-70 family RNA polymerase sigma factor [bacterium]
MAKSSSPAPVPDDRTEPAVPGASSESLLRQGYRFALSLTHEPSRAEDLLQDGWLSLLKANGPRTAAYLITAIRSRFVDQHRRNLIAPMESLDDRFHPATEAENGFWSDPCEGAALKMTLQRALGLLRPEERAVLLLSAVEGYTAREIGELLDAPRGTILSLMHRTRAKLRRWLTTHSEPEART